MLGNASIVAAGARIAGSVVGAGVTVGSGARLLRSVVHDGAVVSDEAETIDSVVGERALLGSGAIASDHTIVGADATRDAGARASGARIRRAEPDAPEPTPMPTAE